MKARKKFFTMFLSMLLVFTMMPLSAIPVTAADSTDPPPAALDQTKLVDETLTETDIQTETESTTTPEPDPGVTATGRMTASQPTMTAAATGDAHLKVIMDNGQTLSLCPGDVIRKDGSGDYYKESEPRIPGIYVAYLTKTATYQWTLELNGFNGQSITYVPGKNYANSVVLSLNGTNVLAPKDGHAVDANQHNYRAISCGKETGDGKPMGLSFIIDGDGSLAINANDRNTAHQMLTAQCIFTQGLTIQGDAKVSIDLKLPSYESEKYHAIFTSDLYVIDNASLDIKSYNVGEVVRASSHRGSGNAIISINTTGTVNVEFGCDELERTYPRVFNGYPAYSSFAIENVGYMSIARKGYRSDNDDEPDNFEFVANPKITVSESLTVKTFTADYIKRIQYFPKRAAAVRVQLFDGRIQDGKFKAYDELWGPLKDGAVDITITAPESAAPFARWSTITENLTAEDPGADLPVNGQPVSNKTVTLHITGAGHYYILAKYDPFGGTPTWTKGYSPAANRTTGTVSWTAPDSMKDVKGMLVPATFQLSGSSPVAAKDTSGNDIDKVKSGVSVFAKQSGSGITYVLSDTGAKRIALNFDGRWHFSEPFVPDLDDLTLPPAPQLVSLNCSGGQTPLAPRETACYPFARGLIVKATNFDYDKYEMYYTFNKSGSGGNDPGEPIGTSPRANNGVIVLKDSETWLGVTNLRVRFKSKATGAWSPTTKILLQKISESQNQLYEVTFAPEGNYTKSGSIVTITDSITATVTKINPDQWPINAELVYHTNRFSPYNANYVNYTEGTPVPFDPDTIAASGETAAYLRVGVRVPDPQSSSTDYSVIRKSDIDIKLPESYKLFLWDCTATVDGKQVADNSNVAVGKTVTIQPNVPQGYTFKGWNSPDGLTITDLGNGTYSFTMPKQNVTIKAILYAKEYTDVNVVLTTPSNGNSVDTAGINTTKTSPSEMSVGLQWYKGSQPYHGVFESEKACYRIHITCHAAEGAIFSDSVKIKVNKSPDNGWPVTRDFTLSADKKTLEFDAWLVYAPEITIPLHEGDSTKPTAADCILPPGLTVETLTWNTDGTIKELRVKEPSYPFGDTICRFSFGNGWATINGQRYQGEFPPRIPSGNDTSRLVFKNISIPTVPKGVEVRGTVKSYGSDSENVTVTLTPASGTSLTTTVTGNSANYFFDTVPAGTYTLKVEKKGHAPWTENITVGTDNITGKNVTVNLYGDVNRDGKVNGTDALWVRQSGAGSRTLDAYQKVLADLNRDGKVNGTDVLWIRQIGAGSRTLTY